MSMLVAMHAGDTDKARGPDPLLPHHLQLRAAVQHHGGALWPLADQRTKGVDVRLSLLRIVTENFPCSGKGT